MTPFSHMLPCEIYVDLPYIQFFTRENVYEEHHIWSIVGSRLVFVTVGTWTVFTNHSNLWVDSPIANRVGAARLQHCEVSFDQH